MVSQPRHDLLYLYKKLYKKGFKQSFWNHVEGSDVLKVKTELGDFEALPLQSHHVKF